MAEEKIDQIFKAAALLMSEKGFERASMDEIALAAGVAKGTLYYHFKNKDDLFISMVQISILQLTKLVRRELDKADNPSEKLSLLIKFQVNYLRDNANFCKILLSEVWGTDERQRKFRQSLAEYLKIIREILEAGKEQGRFSFEDTETAAAGIFGAISIASLHWILNDKPLPEDKITNTVKRLVLDGIGLE